MMEDRKENGISRAYQLQNLNTLIGRANTHIEERGAGQ